MRTRVTKALRFFADLLTTGAFRLGLLVSVVIAVVGCLMTELHSAMQREIVFEKLANNAAAIAEVLPAESLTLLREVDTARAQQASRDIAEHLAAARAANPDFKSLSVVTRFAGRLEVLTEGERLSSFGPNAQSGFSFNSPLNLEALFTAARPWPIGPYEDPWGHWISVIAPLRNDDGLPIGVLSIDASARDYFFRLFIARMTGGIGTALFVLLALAFSAAIAHTKKLRATNLKLEREIAERRAVQSELQSSHNYLDEIVRERTLTLTQVNDSLLREIAERQKAETELEESAKRYALVVQNISDVIWTTDMSFRFTYVSPSVYRLRGVSAEEALRETLRDVLPPESFKKALEVFTCELNAEIEAASPVRSHTLELEQRCKDGTAKWTEVRATVLRDENGVPFQILGVSRDISERRNAEREREVLARQLQHAQKMEAVGQLAGGVAHDFNNLLTSITGNLSLGLLDIDPDHPLFELLSDASAAAKRAAGLTRQLLAFSRKSSIEPKPLSINSIVQGVDQMLRRLIGEDANLTTVLGEGLWRVMADPSQMEQVLVNLVVNASNALENDPRQIFIETRNVTIEQLRRSGHASLEPGEYVVLAVTDTGQEIDEAEKQRIFEPFFVPKGRGAGAGLGLATVFGIVQRHGGAIEVESTLGRGATFALYLPREESPAGSSIAAPSLEAALGGNETILFAEDEPTVRAMTSRLLTRLGYNVISAENGGAALDQLDKAPQRIDLLLTDVIMPEMNGVQLARHVVERQKGVKILFTSGYSGDVLGHHGLVTEEVNYIGKPYAPQELAAKIRDVLDRKSSF